MLSQDQLYVAPLLLPYSDLFSQSDFFVSACSLSFWIKDWGPLKNNRSWFSPSPPGVRHHFDALPSRLLKALITYDLPVPGETKPPLTTVDSFCQEGPHVTFSKLNYVHSQALKNPLPSDLIASRSTSNMSVTEVRPFALIQFYNGIWKLNATLPLDSL